MSVSEVKAQFELAKQGLKAIRDKNSAVRQAAQQGNQSIIDEINQINDKIARIKELVGRSNQLDSALKAKENELDALRKEKDGLNNEFSGVKEERDNLQQKLRENEENMNSVNALIVTRDDEAREKNRAMEELEQTIAESRGRLEQINTDLQDLLGDITQVNIEINETDGEVQTLNQYNNETVDNIKTLLQKVNLDLNEVLNMPQPPASQMQQIHEQRIVSRATPQDEIEQGVLSNLFEPQQQESGPGVEQLSPKDRAVFEASSQPWWNTLDESGQAMYRNVPEKRGELQREGMLREQQENSRRAREASASNGQFSRPIYLTEWKNELTPEEMRRFDTAGPDERDIMEEEGRRRLAIKKSNQGNNPNPVGGRRRRSRNARAIAYRNRITKNKKGGYVAVYKQKSTKSKSSDRTKSTRRTTSARKNKQTRKY